MIPPTISKIDLLLINKLSGRKYSGNQLLSNASLLEQEHLRQIISKLKLLAENFKTRYDDIYGPFETSVTTGNPLAIGGISFKRIWSGIFKGAVKKQYSAQISFVMNPIETCLDVGFYFGRASGHSLAKAERIELESTLKQLGHILSESISTNTSLLQKYNQLFDFGFQAFIDQKLVLNQNWIREVKRKAKGSQIVVRIFPNDAGVIEFSTIDFYVSLCICLMSAIPETPQIKPLLQIKPLTPEQRAKQAERQALIGQKGEIFVMQYERERLASQSGKSTKYPKHVALDSMTYGYDILSLGEHQEEIYIEVKTTTRLKDDILSRSFFLSEGEYNMAIQYRHKYKIYRVYDIEGNPSLEEVSLDSSLKSPNGYVIKY